MRPQACEFALLRFALANADVPPVEPDLAALVRRVWLAGLAAGAAVEELRWLRGLPPALCAGCLGLGAAPAGAPCARCGGLGLAEGPGATGVPPPRLGEAELTAALAESARRPVDV